MKAQCSLLLVAQRDALLRSRTSPSNSTATRHTYTALLNYDILSIIFNFFDQDDINDRAACARAARVCSAWTEPASHALWIRCRWRFQDLYNVLQQYTPREWDSHRISHFLKTVTSRYNKKSVDRQRFLHCSARVRHLRLLQTSPTPQAEIELLEHLLSWNDGMTFLPSLWSISWLECPSTDGLLLRLVPSCLERLELIVDDETTDAQIGRLLGELPQSAPFLYNVTIFWWSSCELPMDAIIRNTSIRRLSFHGRIILTLREFQTLLSLPALEYIRAHIGGSHACSETITSGNSLKALHCFGTCHDLTTLASKLRAPALHHLDLQINARDSSYDPPAHLSLSRTLATMTLPSTPNIRSLQLGYRGSFASTLSTTGPFPAVCADVLRPLFSVKGLQLDSLEVDFQRPVHLTDDEVLEIAKAWPMLKSLTLGLRYMGGDPTRGSLPTPRALLHIARSCPDLASLKIHLDCTLAAIESASAFAFESSSSPAPAPARSAHPLRILRLAQPGERLHYADALKLARIVDAAFPNIDVHSCVEEGTPSWMGWRRLWDFLGALQEARRTGEEVLLSLVVE